MNKIQEFCNQFNLDEHSVKSLTTFIFNRVSILKERGLLNTIEDKAVFSAFVEKSVEDWHKSSQEFFNRMLNPKTKKDFEDLNYLKEEVYKACKIKSQN